MHLRLGLFALLLLIVSFVEAQNTKLTGKVTNEKNEPLAGVSVKIAGQATGTTTDVEGRYNLSLSAGQKYELEFSLIGYEPKTITDVDVSGSQINDLNVVLTIKVTQGEGVTVTGRRFSAKLETVNAAISFQRNTNTVASVISAESIRRSPDKNTGEVLKRTPGTSIQEGKYLVVRGLADRYNQAMLNGILLSSTEADRKTFSFDLFPSSMIDNIIINKAFVPELPGEWAGGLVQVNTRDIPAKNFLNIQIGTGFNTQTIGNDFYSYKGGSTDWLGIDDGTRGLPSSYPTSNKFQILPVAEKIEVGKQFENIWAADAKSAPINASFQASGGFSKKFNGSKQLGVIIGLTYNKTNRLVKLTNNGYNFSTGTSGGTVVSPDFLYNDDKYAEEVLWGALGAITYQFNNNNKISYKTIFNVNTSDYTTMRSGTLQSGRSVFDSLRGSELGFKQNMFWNNQLLGEHNFTKQGLKLKWFGGFTILDAYIPDQRRLSYTKDNENNKAYEANISGVLSQQSGNRFYQFLNDYVYVAGGDLSKGFKAFNLNQSVKVGYLFQVRDRLFDSKPFSNYLPSDNPQLRLLAPNQIFNPANFGTEANQLAFDQISGKIYRYLANNILNAGFVQFDNQFSKAFRLVWGVRLENFDQLMGSVKTFDSRHSHTEVFDVLPGLNATIKLNTKTNLRISGSQTVVRPELRELASFQFYDFDLNATVQGAPNLQRTKITNADIRYELYPRAGETFSAGVFYKNFDKPIEQIFQKGGGGSSIFNFANPEKAEAYGAELEFRKSLDFVDALKNFTFLTNLSYIKSKVSDKKLDLDRPLQGQSSYLINAGILYDLEKLGLNASVLYNQIGERIAYVGTIGTGGDFSPDIWESSRPLLDFQATKKILKTKGEIRLSISDILNKKVYFYQNSDGNTKLNKGTDTYRFTRQFGTTFSLTFGYNF
jgi:outer membrane receptor protein involved in Fe transport